MIQSAVVDVQVYKVPCREMWAESAAEPLKARLEIRLDCAVREVSLDRENAGWSSLGGALAFDYVHGSRLGKLRTRMLAGQTLIRSSEIDDLADRVLSLRSSSATDTEGWAERLAQEASKLQD